jgi:periplasmic divalent cation tolerance protein
MSAAASVYAVFGSEEEARTIGRAMVEQGFAACVNILGPCHSIYRWKGEVQETTEVAVLFKTLASVAPELIRRVAALHSYDVPGAVAWPISDLPESYRAWIAENV